VIFIVQILLKIISKKSIRLNSHASSKALQNHISRPPPLYVLYALATKIGVA
jgi:hypothetical protein